MKSELFTMVHRFMLRICHKLKIFYTILPITVIILAFILGLSTNSFSDEIWIDGQSPSGHIIKDEGTTVRQDPYLDFVGSSVAVTTVGDKTTVTVDPSAGGYIPGSGTLHYLSKWTPDGTTLGNSQIYDDGTNIGIGTPAPTHLLSIYNALGSISETGDFSSIGTIPIPFYGQFIPNVIQNDGVCGFWAGGIDLSFVAPGVGETFATLVYDSTALGAFVGQFSFIDKGTTPYSSFCTLGSGGVSFGDGGGSGIIGLTASPSISIYNGTSASPVHSWSVWSNYDYTSGANGLVTAPNAYWKDTSGNNIVSFDCNTPLIELKADTDVINKNFSVEDGSDNKLFKVDVGSLNILHYLNTAIKDKDFQVEDDTVARVFLVDPINYIVRFGENGINSDMSLEGLNKSGVKKWTVACETGAVDTVGSFISRGNSFPSSGQTVELYLASSAGRVKAFNYDTTTYLPLILLGSTISLNTDGVSPSFYIDATQQVGIGTESPSTRLDVNGVITATGGNSTQWNTAYGWGDHSTQGYLKNINNESIGDLSDVDLTGLTDGQLLKWNVTSGNFEPYTESSASVHNNLSGLQGGTTAQYYHLTSTEHGYVSGANSQSLLTSASPSFNGLNLEGDVTLKTDITIRNNADNYCDIFGDDSGTTYFRFSAKDTGYHPTNYAEIRAIGAGNINRFVFMHHDGSNATFGSNYGNLVFNSEGGNLWFNCGDALGVTGFSLYDSGGVGQIWMDSDGNIYGRGGFSIGQGLAGSAIENTNIGTELLIGPGNVKDNFDMLILENTANAVDMDDTKNNIKFRHYYYDATTPDDRDSGLITVGTETDWTSTASTQDSYMSFATALNGNLTEKMRIDSVGNVDIVGTLKGDGLALPHTVNKTASANVRNSHNAVATSTSATYVLAKTITLPNGLLGQQRFLFDIKTSDVLVTCYGRIKRNGAWLGTEQSTVLLTYDTKSEDITQDFNPGDTVELWVHSDGAATVSVQNMQLAYDDAPTVTVSSVNN